MKVKLLTLNIWHGARLPAVIGFLRNQDADVIMLQEVYDSADSALDEKYRSFKKATEQLGYPYAEFGKAYDEKLPSGAIVPHGNAILSKLPISANSVINMAGSGLPFYEDKPEHWPILPAPLQYAQIHLNGNELNVYNVHGVWDLDGDAYTERRQIMEQCILEAISDKPNVILAGDSNATPGNPMWNSIRTQLLSVFGEEVQSTFNMKHKTLPGYATAVVDVIYVSPELRIISNQIPEDDVSDHRPLVAIIEV